MTVPVLQSFFATASRTPKLVSWMILEEIGQKDELTWQEHRNGSFLLAQQKGLSTVWSLSTFVSSVGF